MIPRCLVIPYLFAALLSITTGRACVASEGMEGQVRVLADRLSSDELLIRRAATLKIMSKGKQAIPILIRLIESKNCEVSIKAFELLGRIGVDSASALIKLTKHRSADIRFLAARALGGLAPEAQAKGAVKALAKLLRDRAGSVVCEAAWALAAYGTHAAPAVKKLIDALEHTHPDVPTLACGALASIGVKASSSTKALIKALQDSKPAVRRSAAEALGAIGPKASAAVSQLTKALMDENIYVRICAAGALGSMGVKAKEALGALRQAEKQSALRNEARWAIQRISGIFSEVDLDVSQNPSKPFLSTSDQAKTVGAQRSAIASSAQQFKVVNEPVIETFRLEPAKNILWSARIGAASFGGPVFAHGMIFIGTDNGLGLNPGGNGECGVLLAFDAKDGSLAWQDSSLPLKRQLKHFLLPSTTSSPTIEGERLYYLTWQCQLRCLDLSDLFTKRKMQAGAVTKKGSAVKPAIKCWELDIPAELGVFPHEALSCSVAIVEDLLMVSTGNGVNEAHTRVPAPRAPSFIGVNKKTGRVVWQFRGPGKDILHGQWSSPAVAKINGRTLAIFGGGNGWLYALDAKTGRLIWKYDGNSKEALWRPSSDRMGIVSRNAIVASPLVHNGRIYLAMGQDPEHGEGKGALHVIDPTGRGDITGRNAIWINAEVGRVVGAPIIKDDLLYLGDLNGYLHCLNLVDGKHVWKQDLGSQIWGNLLIAGDQLWVGDEDGFLWRFKTGRELALKEKFDFGEPLRSSPIVANGVLYVATSKRIYAIGKKE